MPPATGKRLEAEAAENFKGTRLYDSMNESAWIRDGKGRKKEAGSRRAKEKRAQKQLGAHENALQCFLLLFPQYSPWALSLMVWHMNCIKLLLISCRVAERWITVRGLSYICHWPLSTSVVLSTLGWLIILLLIQRQLVMPHTWQLLDNNIKTRSWLCGDRNVQRTVEI